MKRLRSKNKLKRLLLPLLSVLILGASFLWILHPKEAAAAWFDTNWDYRKSIAISSHTAAENNVYIIVTIDTSDTTRFQSDCGDLRFTDQNGKALAYYIVSGCTTSSTVIHVQFVSFSAGAQTIYYYYGNPSAQNGFSGADFSTQASSYVVGSIGAEQQTPGPTLYWKFDDGTGTTAKDSSSSNNSGTLGGTTIPTWQTEDQCISAKCLFFDGASSKVTGSAVLKAIQTVAFWVRPNTIATQGLLNLDGGTHKVSTNSSGVISATGFTSPTYYINGVATTSPTLVQNQWNFVEITTGTSFDTTSSFTIGTDGTNFIKGFIDAPRIYNYARSSPQVQADFNSRGSLVAGANTIGTTPNNQYSALNQGLVGYWKADESSGNTTDSSGNGNTGTNNGTTTYTAGKFGNAGTFNGSTQYFDMGNVSAYNFGTGNFTVSAWYKLNANSGLEVIAGKEANVSTNGDGFSLFWDHTDGDLLAFKVPDGSSNLSVSGAVTYDTNWHHVVGVRNGSTLFIYRDGIKLGGGTASDAIGANNITNSSAFRIGDDASGSNFFNGSIDDTRLYSRALSPAEVQTLYNFAPGPVGYWNFEEGQGTTANDTSGNAQTGTLNNGPSWSEGKIGKAVSFATGASQSISATTTFSNLGTMTYSAWIYPRSGGESSLGRIIYKRNNAGAGLPSISMDGGVNNSHSLRFEYGRSDGVEIWETAANTITYNAWNYITVAYDNSSASFQPVMSVNGTPLTVTTITSRAGTPSSDDTRIYIGNRNDGARTFDGIIDEVRVYNYAETQKQIISDMNASHPSVGGNQPSAVGFWKFDEGADNKCSGGTNDACNSGNGGNGLDLAQSGMASPATSTSGWTNSGKFNKALVFDGTNDYLATSGNPNALKLTSNLTLSAWINLTNTSATHNIIAKDGASGNFGYRLYTNTSGQLVMEVSSDGTATTTSTETSLTLATGTWYHVVGVYIPSTSLTLYINGNQVKQTTASIPSSIFNSTVNVNIGGQNAGTNLMNGSIDEAKIYNYDLSPSDVLLDYNHSSSEVLGSVSTDSTGITDSFGQDRAYCVPGSTNSCAGPVGEWQFDEGTGTSVSDSSGNGNTGTWNGTGTAHWLSGKYNKAGNFNGSDDYVSEPTVISTIKTISFWVYPTASTNYFIDLDSGTHYLSTSAGALTATGFTSPTYYINGVVQTSPTLQTNQWNYVTVTTGTGINSTNPLTIGKVISSGSKFLVGKIDQVRVFNYARSAAQVSWDYNRGAPLAWWKFDECQGTVANDASGNGSTGTITIGGTGSQTTAGTCTSGNSAHAWSNGAAGKINSALNFDGTDDRVRVANNTTINQTGAMSASAWIKPSVDVTDYRNFMWHGPLTDAKQWYIELLLNTGTLNLVINWNSGHGGGCSVASTKAYNDNSWHLINVIFDGSNTWSLYADSQLVGTCNSGAADNTNSFFIGAYSGNQSRFQGLIDDVRLYGYPLTTTQIRDIYNNGAVRYGPSTGSP